VHCKFRRKGNPRNIVELAKPGDWIIGTGGSSSKETAESGRIIYLMHVDDNPPFDEFLTDRRFAGRIDCIDQGTGNEFALISKRYSHFGGNAVAISDLPTDLAQNLAKRGPGFRRDYSEAKLIRLIEWFESHFRAGVRGQPCAGKICLKQRCVTAR
jgi:hypothetical protein